ncbi:hypothetical protein VTL71DRAFT_10616 [Oculimacula yallundae]|uniref:NAD-dependent epimerase/dehydratase domain-containing protein n=1 Tax=Oculimacula yallundae TaxID=86028 RepID=A0ABR4CUM9_9HELO
MATHQATKTVLVTGANGYIGHAIALAFVRAGYKTYGLVRNPSFLSTLASEEIIPLLGSPSSPSFLPSLAKDNIVFDVLVSTTEDIFNYFPHYNDIVSLLRTLAKLTIEEKGTKPLLLFTSGCKDYGMSSFLADSVDLVPHTEESPLNPPSFAVDRAEGTKRIFENEDLLDVVVLRPTNVYGGNSSYYGLFFVAAEEGKTKGVLEVAEEPMTVLHAMHVDDCGEAYVALAEHPDRKRISGQRYNVSAADYETLDDILHALAKEYGIEDVKYVKGEEGRKAPSENLDRMLMGFSQWTSSEKLRKQTGWTDRRLLFTEGLYQYRIAFEEARKKGLSVLQGVAKKPEGDA